MNESNEMKLVMDFRKSKLKVDELEETLKVAKAEVLKLEHKLIEHLENIGADSTATYQGIRVQLQKPRLFASYLKENEATVFEFVRNEGREDLIKPSIHGSSLSAWVKERIESGQEVPEFVNYYLKPTVKLY